MLADLFAPANLMTTLLCIAALVFAGVGQYWLCRSAARNWIRRLPVLMCSGAAVLFLAMFFFTISSNGWHALTYFFAMMFAVLLLIACAIGCGIAHCKQNKAHKETHST